MDRIFRYAGLGLAVVTLGLALLVLARYSPDSARTSPGHGGWVRAGDPLHGWTLRYPSGWDVQPFVFSAISFEERGILVKNGNAQLSHNGTNFWRLDDLPPDFVVIHVAVGGGTFGVARNPKCGSPDAGKFPLWWRKGRYLDGPADERWPRHWFPFNANGMNGQVNVWFGPEVAPEDVQAAKRVVSSITAPQATGCVPR